MQEIKIFENFIPKYYQQSLLDMTRSFSFPWFFSPNTSGAESSGIRIFGSELEIAKNQSGFSHIAYVDEIGENSSFYQRIVPLIFSIEENTGEKINNLLRVRLGMTLNSGESGGIILPHVDYEAPHKTLLYYLNDSDGDTLFYKEMFKGSQKDQKEFNVTKTNAPKMGTAVLFDGHIYHSSSLPTKNIFRITLNINFN